jgi:nucleotide-binding universal stress UspA family protein
VEIMPFHKILCAIDFSTPSLHAVRVAVALAKQLDAELVLAHAWYVPTSAITPESDYTSDDRQWIVDHATRGLQAALREAVELGARRVTTRLLDGNPWHAVTALLEAEPTFDLVVTGTQGRTGIKRVLLGSTAEAIVRHAPCSALAVHPGTQPTGFTNVLCPTDFSPSSLYAIELAAKLVRPDGCLTLLHVVEAPVSYAGSVESMDFMRTLDIRSTKHLDELAARVRTQTTARVMLRNRVGNPGSETLAVLDDDATFDLVAMGSHGRTGLRRMILGSVAEKVVRHSARCPVIVARQRPEN